MQDKIELEKMLKKIHAFKRTKAPAFVHFYADGNFFSVTPIPLKSLKWYQIGEKSAVCSLDEIEIRLKMILKEINKEVKDEQ